MNDKLKITKIEITTREGKKLALSVDEAKGLYDQLDELFGQKSTPYIPYVPIFVDRTRPYWQPYNPVWCNGGVTCSSNNGLSVGYYDSEG